MKQFLIGAIIAFISGYLVQAFINAEIDFRNWEDSERMIVLISTCIGVIYGYKTKKTIKNELLIKLETL